MDFFRRHRRLLGWLASAAILLSAIAPTLSYAMAEIKGDDSRFIEVCTVSGNKLVPAADFIALAASKNASSSQDQDSKGKSMPMEHCPYCLNQAGAHAIFNEQVFLRLLVDLSYSFPPLFYRSPAPLFVWASASPRAPPAFS